MMYRRLCVASAAVISAVLMACGASAQGSPETIAKIIEEGKNNNQAKATLIELSEKIGARVTGSLALERGFDWAVNKFKSHGLDNATLEQWGTVPIGFDRGERQSAGIVGPYDYPFQFTTPCWTVGTDGPVRGSTYHLPKSVKAVKADADAYKGSWILMPGEMGMRGPKLQKPTAVDKALDEAGIAGRIYKSSGELVWTHGTWNDYTEETRPKTPLLVVRKSDYEMIEYNMKKGRDPQVEVDIEHIFTYREMPQSNVIAEIVGTEKPEEVVIISGHFDSWNGPGSTGASDNGTGSSSTIEAARILKAVGAQPKRTIRFILWSGEEQGLLGSRAYVEAHKDELDNISAILVEDSGQNWQSGVGGLPEMMPMLTEALKPMANAFEDMPVKPHEVRRLSRGGSDHGSFVNKGVPGFFLNKGGSLSYRHVWHTQNDKPSEVPEKNIRQMSTNMAVIAYNLACAEDMMPRVALGRTTAHPAVGGYFAEDDHDFCKCGQILEVGYQLSRRGF